MGEKVVTLFLTRDLFKYGSLEKGFYVKVDVRTTEKLGYLQILSEFNESFEEVDGLGKMVVLTKDEFDPLTILELIYKIGNIVANNFLSF